MEYNFYIYDMVYDSTSTGVIISEIQDSIYNIGSLQYTDTIVWNSDDDLFNIDTGLFLELSILDCFKITFSTNRNIIFYSYHFLFFFSR